MTTASNILIKWLFNDERVRIDSAQELNAPAHKPHITVTTKHNIKCIAGQTCL